jgi:hypothetical protein
MTKIESYYYCLTIHRLPTGEEMDRDKIDGNGDSISFLLAISTRLIAYAFRACTLYPPLGPSTTDWSFIFVIVDIYIYYLFGALLFYSVVSYRPFNFYYH